MIPSNNIILPFQLGIIFLFHCLDYTQAECIDIYGRSITPNTHFIPGPDICQLCVCDNTSPKWCKRVLCSPPQNCKSFVVGSSCCDYSCLDNTLPSGELRDEIDRRFLITIATAFLILTVLLFIIHKLRHRSVQGHIQNRQLNEDRRSMGSIGFITGSIGYLNLPNSHHFDDHPLVHFPIYKPNGSYFPRGEAPPPYEEAMADTTLSVSYTSQFITNERGIVEHNSQRRRNNSAGIGHFPNHLGVATDRGYACLPQLANNNLTTVENAAVYNYVTQHRTIPLPLCLNNNQADNTATRRSCSFNNDNITVKNEVDHCSRINSITHRGHCLSLGRRNTCPPQYHPISPYIGETCLFSHHRTLPLSASLSSPLPSTSNSNDSAPFPGASTVVPFSLKANICSANNENEPEPNVQNLSPVSAKNHHHRDNVTREKSPSSSAQCVPQVESVKEKNLAHSNCIPTLEHSNKEGNDDNQDSGQYTEDYYAECENCNINVGVGCDGPDEYFSKQETMTLQRKLYEASTTKSNNETMKVSLTLPANCRTRRCPLKTHSCSSWNTKEHTFKINLEYVSSEGEEELIEEMKGKDENSQGNEQNNEKPDNKME